MGGVALTSDLSGFYGHDTTHNVKWDDGSVTTDLRNYYNQPAEASQGNRRQRRAKAAQQRKKKA